MIEKAFCEEARCSPSRSTTRSPTTRGPTPPSTPWRRPPAAGRRPDPDAVPQAVRELGVRLRDLIDRLLQKLLAFVEEHAETEADKKRLERWRDQNEDVLLGYAARRQLSLWDDDGDRGRRRGRHRLRGASGCGRSCLDRDEYDVDEILDETYLDLDQIVRFLAETQQFEPKHDDKLNKLKRLLDVEGPR